MGLGAGQDFPLPIIGSSNTCFTPVTMQGTWMDVRKRGLCLMQGTLWGHCPVGTLGETERRSESWWGGTAARSGPPPCPGLWGAPAGHPGPVLTR